MNWIDALIGAVAPVTALRRVAAREALRDISNRYEAARADRALEGWWTTGNSANAEIGGALATLRKRSRDLARNNPYVARSLDIVAGKMVGTGIRPRLAEDVGASTRRRVMDDWKRWVDEADAEGLHDLYGLEAMASRCVAESGEALLVFEPSPNSRIPWKVRVLEPDYIDADKTGVLDNGNRVIQGVEYQGRMRVAYHMFVEHPGDDLLAARKPGGAGIVRVPADQVAPIFRSLRPEQAHGVPWCAPIVALTKNLDDLNDARLKRAKTQACFSAFVRRQADAADISITTESETQRRKQQLAPGMIEYLMPDEEISFASPPAGEKDEEWQLQLLHAIAVGSGVTYSQMTGDLRQANYSSMRAGSIDFWCLLDQWQQLMLQPMMCRRLWQKFVQAQGVRENRETMAVEWDFPERPFIDPVKDGEAADNALLSGRKTFRETIAGRGRDPEAHIDELRTERGELADLGLPHIQPQQQDSMGDGEELVSSSQA